MGNEKCRVSPVMKFAFLFGITFILAVCPSMARESPNMVRNKSKGRVQKEDEKHSGLQTYIVFVKKPKDGISAGFRDVESWHRSFLPDSANEERMLYSYRNVVDGFAAKLTAEEVKIVEEKEGFVSASPEKIYSLHTTHTPSFLGLQQGIGVWKGPHPGQGVIIGVLDTGLFPDHPSFSDEGMLPPPSKWNGRCDFNGQRTCNNKLLGARNMLSNSTGSTPADDFGHGTHTASTAAGNFVQNASVFGNAQGTAVGMAPYAHLAIYKVCSLHGCPTSAILAGLDTAIGDGVDVLSLSLGGGSNPFFDDVIAVGAFSAIQKGILVSCSAANGGPAYGSLSNEAPWILTVAASTVDRNIRATVKLGNGGEFDGQSLFQPSDFDSSKLLPLVYAGSSPNPGSAFCAEGSLKSIDVRGKIVLCDAGGGIPRIQKGVEVKNAGGAGMILANEDVGGYTTMADPHVLPASHVSYTAGLNIKEYMNSTSTPTATILFKGTIIGDRSAPAIASFSSRGPSLESPGILKPDITGPGVSILAAWPFSIDNVTHFNMISGTSMSCPHLSGIAALLKSNHPDWSPAAIKSAIMTSAEVLNLDQKPIVDQTFVAADIFATGAGHVNPNKSNDPGLVFDLQPQDYIPYLCGLGYTNQQIALIVNGEVDCSKVGRIEQAQLNYPSFSIIMDDETQDYTRTATNVGPAVSTYTANLDVPLALGMSINPSTLSFTEENQKATFNVEFIPSDKENRGNHTFAQGAVTWVSDTHTVRMPISVIFK